MVSGSCQARTAGAARLPGGPVFGEGEAEGVDVSSGLLQGEGQAVELAGDRAGDGVVVGLDSAVRGPLDQEGGGVGLAEDVELQGADAGGPVGDPRGDEEVAAAQLRQEVAGLLRRVGRVHVVEDQEPARVLAEPAQDLGEPLLLVHPGRVRRQDADEVGQVGAERGRVGAGDEQEGGVFRLELPGVLDRRPRLADAPQAVDRLLGHDRHRPAPHARQPAAEVEEEILSPLEQRAQGVERDVPRPGFPVGDAEDVLEHPAAKLVERAELDPVADALEMQPVEGVLQGGPPGILLRRVDRAAREVLGVGQVEEHRLAARRRPVEPLAHREVIFPLGVGSPRPAGRPVSLGRLGAVGRADDEDDAVGRLDLRLELLQDRPVVLRELLLDDDLRPRRVEVARQLDPALAELVGGRGQEDLLHEASPSTAVAPASSPGDIDR